GTSAGGAGAAPAVATRAPGRRGGAARSRVGAAAAATPLRIRGAAVGTAASLSVGRMAPATPATGTAATGVSGNRRRRIWGVRKVVTAAESGAPRTRKGRATSTIETKVVARDRKSV